MQVQQLLRIAGVGVLVTVLSVSYTHLFKAMARMNADWFLIPKVSIFL